MDIERVLKEEIVTEFENLKSIEVGSETYKNTVDGAAKLMDRAIELEKIKNEQEQQAKTREDDRKDRLIKNIISGASILLPIGVTIWGTCKSIQFEKEGTFTTIMGRGFINKLLPKK